MSALLITASLVEAVTGFVLLVFPAIVIKLLFGEEIVGAGVSIGRVAAISLIALAVACWPNVNPCGAFNGMVTYSVLVMLYLIGLGMSGTVGVLLWPAVGVHAVLSVLLIWARWKQPKSRT